MNTERRRKILSLPLEFPLTIMLSGLRVGDRISQIRFRSEDFPDGISVLAVTVNHERSCWDYHLSHPSWPEVTVGEMIPRIEDMGLELVTLTHESVTTFKSWRDKPSMI